jgi:hypothetical protein
MSVHEGDQGVRIRCDHRECEAFYECETNEADARQECHEFGWSELRLGGRVGTLDRCPEHSIGEAKR